MTISGLTYDAGALLAAEGNDRSMFAIHSRALKRGVLPLVPAPVLAQAWRGGPQPLLSRLLAGCSIEILTEPTARAAGALCGQAGTSDVVDAVVVTGAVGRGDAVVTSDPGDLLRLAEVTSQRIELIAV